MAKKLDIDSQRMLDDFNTPAPAYEETPQKKCCPRIGIPQSGTVQNVG